MSIILKILQTKKITEYLEKLGHQPFKSLSGGKLAYLCPFPDHHEKKPSFIIWTNAEYENFKCFGCGRHFHIIHLYSELNNISYKESVRQLGDGMDISSQESLDAELSMIERKFKSNHFTFGLGEQLESVSSLCRNYLSMVNEKEVTIVDKFYQKVDENLMNYEYDKIHEMLQILPDFLHQRMEKLLK